MTITVFAMMVLTEVTVRISFIRVKKIPASIMALVRISLVAINVIAQKGDYKNKFKLILLMRAVFCIGGGRNRPIATLMKFWLIILKYHLWYEMPNITTTHIIYKNLNRCC